MNSYLFILKKRMRLLTQYRAAAFASILTQTFWGIVQGMLVTAFFSFSPHNSPISLEQTLTFIWIGQSLIQLLPWTIDKEIEMQVKSGDIIYELVRPLDLYWLWFVRSLALRLVPTIIRCAPVLIIGGLFFGLTGPSSWEGGTLFSLSLFLALFLSSALTTLVMISLFWTISGEGMQRLLPHVSLLLSGMAVPLPLFPSWLKPFFDVQPMRGIIDIPCRLYTGVVSSSDAIYFLFFQILWSAVLIAFGRYLMNRATKKFVIFGG